jgi:magnesium and cobalt transporter
MMEGVMRVSETQVRDVMIPRAQMVVLEHDWNLERLIAEIVESGHSRLPVIDESKDNVIGILIVKDLLSHAFDRREDFDLRALLRPAKFIPESKRLNILLKEFRGNRLHMAIVVDEYGGVAGLITIEDVLEEIVGEIDDEHDTDDDSAFIRSQGDAFIVKALTPVEDFNKRTSRPPSATSAPTPSAGW